MWHFCILIFVFFLSITLPLLVLIACFIPKNVTTFHEEEVRSFGFCWSFLWWRGNFGLHCPKLAKKVLTQKLPNSSSLFLSFWTKAIFRDQFQKKILCLTFWNKNLWRLWTKNACEHIFWYKNSALRATYIMSINKKDPVVGLTRWILEK